MFVLGGGAMTTQRREYSRIPMPSEQSNTVVIARGSRLPVRMIDAAPFGYAFAGPATLKVSCGDHLKLLCMSEWIEVRVVRAEPLDQELFVGVARVRGLGTIPPDERWLLPFGGHLGLWAVVFALALGILVGAWLITRPQGLWQQVPSLVSSGK